MNRRPTVLGGGGRVGETVGMPWRVPDPSLKTDKVILRQFRIEDAGAVAAACADPDITRFTFMKEGLTDAEAADWITRSHEWWARGHPRFAIVDATTERFLGQVGIAVNEHHRSAEAYYWIAVQARHRGVASDALALVADWSFANGIERLWLLIHPDNGPSSRLAERCGFTREGVLRAYEPFKGTRPDVVSWSLLPDDRRPWRGAS